MRVLVVDQDSSSNEAIARSLRDLFTVDAVTNKGDCLDLLRSNTFEVIVATERLEDGSGLELLGQIARKWPSVLRIFAADRHRLALLKGRLGPFELFQTLTYPIDPDRLIATLSLAEAAQEAHADTTNIQHVVLTADPPPEVIDEVEESSQSGEFPAPEPLPRAVSAGHSRAASHSVRSAHRAPSPHRTPSGPPPRANGAGGSPVTRLVTGASTAHAPTPAPSSSGTASRPLRHRTRSGAGRPPPVRFPPLERTPALERNPPLEPPADSRPEALRTDPIAEAAALARAARSNFDSPIEGFDIKPLAVKGGAAAAAVLLVIVLGFKLLGSSHSEAPKSGLATAARETQSQLEVAAVVAQIESELQADDIKSASVDVDKLRQLSPSHPRLAFFEALLAQRSSAPKSNSSGSAAVHGMKRSGVVRRNAPQSAGSAEAAAPAPAPTPPVAQTATTPSATGASSAPATTPAAGASPTEATPALPPETPPGFTVAQAASSGTTVPPATTPAVTTPAAGATAAPTAPATAGGPATTPGGRATTRPSSSNEPPPVIREAKLIRRVDPDYPSAAKRDGISGSVDLELTVSARGVVENVAVMRANPPDTFEKAAITAVRKWKYDPRFVDGLPSEAHVKVHLEFGPDR